MLQSRLAVLIEDGGPRRAWRGLQYDAICALVHAQVRLVELHSWQLAMLRADRELYEQQRLESLELSLCCDALRELIRKIEHGITGATAAN